MPHKPRKANPDHTVNITFPIPGWLKNDLIKQASKQNIALNKLIQQYLTNAVRETRDLPPLKEADTNPLQPVLDYLTGTRTLNPCGQPTCNKQPTKLNGKTYCNTCGIQYQ